jgi:hypothetical protein
VTTQPCRKAVIICSGQSVTQAGASCSCFERHTSASRPTARQLGCSSMVKCQMLSWLPLVSLLLHGIGYSLSSLPVLGQGDR